MSNSNIENGAKDMCKQLDKATNRQQAEVVADRLRADYMDCMSEGPQGADHWKQIVKAMKSHDQADKGYDVQVTNPSNGGLPTVILFDSQHGINIGGYNLGRDTLIVNEDHSSRKGFYADPESGITSPRSVKPIEMQ